MSSLPAVAKGYFHTYFWNHTQTHGQALFNKALEICTQQKVGNCFWNIGIVALTGAVAGTVALIVNGLFHKILLGIYRQKYSAVIVKGHTEEQVEGYIFDKSTLFPIFSILIRSFAFMAGAVGGYQAASRLTSKLEIFSGDDVIKFTLYPLFTSTVCFFLPVTSAWGGVVVGMAAALPFGAWNGALKNHSLYVTTFSAALIASGVTSTIYRLCNKI